MMSPMKMSESFTKSDSSHGREYDHVSGIVSADEVEMMSQLLTSYSVPNVQTISPWSYDQNASDSVDCEDSMDSNAYFGSESLNLQGSYHEWQNSVATDGHEMYMSSSADLSCDYRASDQETAQYLHLLQNSWDESAQGSNDSDDSGAVDALQPLDIFNQYLIPKRKSQLVDGTESGDFFNPKKRSRSLADIQKTWRTTQDNEEQEDEEEEEHDGSTLDHSLSDTALEENMTVSQGRSGRTSNGKGKTAKGSTAESQSIYAKKRRERINERLRILQGLVPNGTKVDISTMLEEAAQYVKFLQLQIKLLSSNELWMYAPIAYNGMNMGLDLKLSQQ